MTALLLSLIGRMVRLRLLAADDIEAIACELEREGETEQALAVRGAFVEAEFNRWTVPAPDGGNGGS